MTIHWRTDRRELLKMGGGALAGLLAAPNMAWSAEGDTLRLRIDADLQVLDPKGIIGGLDDDHPALHADFADPASAIPVTATRP